METVWSVHKKLKMEILDDVAIPLLGIDLRKQKRYMQHVHCSIIYSIKILEATPVPTDR